MPKNKNGIPIHRKKRQPRGKKPVSKQRTFTTVHDGIEITAVINNHEANVMLLKKSGWREAQ